MDLRRHQRFPVHFHTVLSGPKLNESSGMVINLSEGGACVETDSQVYTGIQIALVLHVPEGETAIRIEKAAVRWSRGRELGVGFITVSPQDKERLGQFLARLQQEPKAPA